MGPIAGFRELLSMILRRGPLIAAISVIGIVATIAYATSLPRTYQASTVIQLEPSALQASSAEGGPDTAARLRLIEQRIMARENIFDMIERHDFFEGVEGLTDLQRLALFRQNVLIELIPSAGGGGSPEAGVSALLITVNAGDPLAAAGLANDIADQILLGNRSAIEGRLADLVSALQEENTRLGGLIEAVEARIETLRREERDALPENLEVLQGRLTSLDDQRVALVRSIQALERERLGLEVGSADPDDPAAPASLVDEIGGLQVQLAQATRRLGDAHPEVIRLRERIAELRAGGTQDLPVGVQRQVALIDEQLATMEEERLEIDRSLAETNRNIARMPQVAERLDQLERQRRNLELQREAVESRLAGARLEGALISDEHGERMVILERAMPPEYPQSSSRRRIAVLGFAASLGLAFLAAFALELRRPVLRTQRQLQRSLGVAPIAVACRRPTPLERVGTKLRLVATVAILGLGAYVSWQLIAPASEETAAES